MWKQENQEQIEVVDIMYLNNKDAYKNASAN